MTYLSEPSLLAVWQAQAVDADLRLVIGAAVIILLWTLAAVVKLAQFGAPIWQRVGKKPAAAEEEEGERGQSVFSERDRRSLAEIYSACVAADGAIQTTLRMHDVYLPEGLSEIERMGGGKEPAWHNPSVLITLGRLETGIERMGEAIAAMTLSHTESSDAAAEATRAACQQIVDSMQDEFQEMRDMIVSARSK